MSGPGIYETLTSFARTRRLSRPSLSRARFETAQARALRRWLDQDLPRVAAYDRAPTALYDLPVTDKARLMENFAAYNRAAITADQVRQAIARETTVQGYTVGASTGTSGNRGLFVISDAERFRWLGTILAKTMADLLGRPQRVAIVLPQNTRLYGAARRVPLLSLAFFDLCEAADRWRRELAHFDPTIIVAPPKVLRHLAETAPDLDPVRVFSAAETLDPVDRHVIEARFNAPLRQIYMASEGLLGVSCAHGLIHLAEDSVHFEYEPVGEGLVSPLITTFRREVQILARYRMNDLLRLARAPCACGSPLQAVTEVVGRMDDCFRLGATGAELITPDVLRNAVLQADARIDDFRLIQMAPDAIELILPPATPEEAAGAAQRALAALLKRRAATARLTMRRADLPMDMSRKLRRVECRLRTP